MKTNIEAHRQRLASLSIADLVREAVIAALARWDSRNDAGEFDPAADRLSDTYYAEWHRRGLAQSQWRDEVVSVYKQELRRRDQINRLPFGGKEV